MYKTIHWWNEEDDLPQTGLRKEIQVIISDDLVDTGLVDSHGVRIYRTKPPVGFNRN